MLAWIIAFLRTDCCIGPCVATASCPLNLWRSAGHELSHGGLDQLFDPSALEISFVPAPLSSTIAGRTPRLTRSIYCFAMLQSAMSPFFGMPFVRNHQRCGARNHRRRIVAPSFGELGQRFSQRLHSVLLIQGSQRVLQAQKLITEWPMNSQSSGNRPPNKPPSSLRGTLTSVTGKPKNRWRVLPGRTGYELTCDGTCVTRDEGGLPPVSLLHNHDSRH